MTTPLEHTPGPWETGKRHPGRVIANAYGSSPHTVGDLYRCSKCGGRCFHFDWNEGTNYCFKLDPVYVPGSMPR